MTQKQQEENMSKSFFIDTTKCTACRGCQVACKEWQGFPANKTTQLGWGSHQNPPDLNCYNYKIVRFKEHKNKNRVIWNFFPDQCRHCIDPPCKMAAEEEMQGTVSIDGDTGAVIYDESTKKLSKKAYDAMREYCSYDVPRRNEQTGVINKCDMCYERVKAGLLPMCVKTCPTGTMNFGDRDKMLQMAKERLEVIKKTNPDAQLLDEAAIRVIYLIAEKPEFYHKKATSTQSRNSLEISRKVALARMTAPLRRTFKNLLG